MIPTPGSSYTVVKGDTLWDIAGSAYGNPRQWKKIYDVNKGKLRDPKIYPNTVVNIFPGEVLMIPGDDAKKKLDSNILLSTDEPGEKLRFVFEGNDIDVTSGRAVLSIDTMADAFSFSVDTKSLPPLTPFGFDPIDVYIDDTKIISGLVFKIETDASKEGENVNISGFSSTQRIVVSAPEPPYQYKNKTLKQIVTEMTSPFDTTVLDEVNDDYRFKKAKIGYNEKIGSFLLKLAGQRQVLLKSNEDSDLEIVRANVFGKPLLTIDDDMIIADPIRVLYDAEKRYSKYIATGKNPSKNIKGVYNDSGILSYSVLSEKADEITTDKINDPAKWMFRKSFIASVGLSFKVDGFYNKDNELIIGNNLVSIQKNTLGLGAGRSFLISSVEYEQTPDSKITTVEFTLPEVYTEDNVNENWTKINE